MITPYVPLVFRENLEKVGNPQHKKSVGNEFVSARLGRVGQKCRLLAVGPTCRRHVGDFPSQGKESSNVREAENLTDRIERLGNDTALTDHEVFVMTDNTAVEGAYYKGQSPSAKLNDIIFRLHKAERDGGFILHVLHISGKRMKATGVDGLSRGDLTEGMLAGADPFSFLPFNRGADDRASGAVGSWVRSWWRTKKGKDWGGMPLEEVTPETMFELKDMQAARLWFMAPAVMETALELFGDDRLAHPQWPHVFVIPHLMTHLWRKNLGKDADVLFTVPAGVPFWTAGQFEPLIVAIVFPLTRTKIHRSLAG